MGEQAGRATGYLDELLHKRGAEDGPSVPPTSEPNMGDEAHQEAQQPAGEPQSPIPAWSSTLRLLLSQAMANCTPFRCRLRTEVWTLLLKHGL